MKNKKPNIFQTFKPQTSKPSYPHIRHMPDIGFVILPGIMGILSYSLGFCGPIDKPSNLWYGRMRDTCVSRFEMVCLTIWTGLRKCALLRVSKPSYPRMSTMSIAYSNSSIASLFDYLYHCYIVYSMVIDWILHCYRQGLQEVYDQPRLLDYHSNGMSNWLPQGLSSYYAYTLLWHMGYS